MEGMEYFHELFRSLPRAGPGDNNSTQKAFSCLKSLPSEPFILDIGCGYGVQTLELARSSKGTIIALDNYQPFLDGLEKNAKNTSVSCGTTGGSMSAPVGIRTRVAGSKGQNDWPDYTTGAGNEPITPR